MADFQNGFIPQISAADAGPETDAQPSHTPEDGHPDSTTGQEQNTSSEAAEEVGLSNGLVAHGPPRSGLLSELQSPSKRARSRWDSDEDRKMDSAAGGNTERSETPEEKCPICLGAVSNRSTIDGCDHKFCYVCILEWSKVKAECPLCKQKFKTISYNYKSDGQYDKFEVPAPAAAPRFRYRTTMTGERYELLREIRRLQTEIMLAQTRDLTHPGSRPPYHQALGMSSRSGPSSSGQSLMESSRRRREQTSNILDDASNYADSYVNYRRTIGIAHNLHRYRRLYEASRQEPRERLIGAPDFRRLIYERGLWVQPLEENDRNTGVFRIRETSPDFYFNNPAQIHRLVPWLDRELRVLLQNDSSRVQLVTETICSQIQRVEIRSRAMQDRVGTVLFQHTVQFLHEFYHFARSPCERLEDYDRQCHYRQIDQGRNSQDAAGTSSSSTVAGPSVAGNRAEGAGSEARSSTRPREEIEVVEEHPAPMRPAAFFYPDIRVPFYERAMPPPSATNSRPFTNPTETAAQSSTPGSSELTTQLSELFPSSNQIPQLPSTKPPTLKQRREQQLLKKLHHRRKRLPEDPPRPKRPRVPVAMVRPISLADFAAETSSAPSGGGAQAPVVDLTADDDHDPVPVLDITPDEILNTSTPPPTAEPESNQIAESSPSPDINVRSDTPPDILRMRAEADARRKQRASEWQMKLMNPGGGRSESSVDELSDPEQPGPSTRKRSRKINSHVHFVSSSSSPSSPDPFLGIFNGQESSSSQSSVTSAAAPGDTIVSICDDANAADGASSSHRSSQKGDTNPAAWPIASAIDYEGSIESSSSSSDSDDLEVLCEMPPKHLRTPPVVTLEDDEPKEDNEARFSSVGNNVRSPDDPDVLPIENFQGERASARHSKERKKHKKEKKKKRRKEEDRDDGRRRRGEKRRRSHKRSDERVRDALELAMREARKRSRGSGEARPHDVSRSPGTAPAPLMNDSVDQYFSARESQEHSSQTKTSRSGTTEATKAEPARNSTLRSTVQVVTKPHRSSRNWRSNTPERSFRQYSQRPHDHGRPSHSRAHHVRRSCSEPNWD